MLATEVERKSALIKSKENTIAELRQRVDENNYTHKEIE